MEETMRAAIRENYGGPEQLRVKDLDIPVPGDGDIRIRVRAFGINRAETYMRKGAWGDVSTISGIECVGEVDLDPSGVLQKGQKVAAIMGGLGRTRPGSYAEYTCAPRTNVFALDTNLRWADLAAIPESFATAWWCLFRSLELERGQSLLIRGAASALGRAAIALASDVGATVVATTRSATKVNGLLALGATDVVLEQSEFAAKASAARPERFDRVLELVGNSAVRESLQLVKPGGALCLAGFLGGLEPIDGFNPIADLPSDVRFSFFGSFALGGEGYPTQQIPMQRIVDGVAEGRIGAKPGRVLPFERIAEAHQLVEANSVEGKIVVEV
jgi:NADPH2:quinone reductase